MLKNTKYIIFISLIFCLFSLNVNAIVYPEGYCIYNFKKVRDKVNNKDIDFSVMIKQDEAGTFKYYYAENIVGDPNDSKWKENSNGNDYVYWNNDKDKNFFKDDRFTSCPSYSSLHVLGNSRNINFSDSKQSNEDNTVYASPTSSSKIKKAKEEDYEGEKCPSDIDWFVKPKKNSSDDVYCLYSGYSNDYGCYIIQFHYNISSKSLEVQDANFFDWTNASGITFYDRNLYIEDSTLKKFSNNVCPSALGIGPRKATSISYQSTGCSSKIGVFSTLYGEIRTVDATCNPFNVRPVLLKKSIPENSSIIIDPNPRTIDGGCPELIGSEMQELLKNIVTVLRIMIPIVLNVFGVIDFVKAVFANDEDKMKKAQSIFIRRLIIGVVIYLIPTVLKLILTVAHNIWPVIDNTLCGIID